MSGYPGILHISDLRHNSATQSHFSRERSQVKTYPIEQAVQAQKTLRAAAGLGPEMFPLEAFVGMISDEIQQLREQGKTNQEIANVIEANPDIKITASEIAENYPPPEERHPSRD
jgi:hypothetical protein